MKRLLLIAALAGTAVSGTAIAQIASPTPAPARHGPGAADTNGDGVITRAEATAAADALFARFDTNHDGKVSAAERPGKHGPDKPDMSREQFREKALKRFDLADANKDGRVDQAERQNLRGKHGRGGGRGDRMARRGAHGGGHGRGMGMMMRADTNRDGVITKAEATAAASAMFDRFDTNTDGRIDPAAREAVRGQMKMRRGAAANAPTAEAR
jgi:hypothetical protein